MSDDIFTPVESSEAEIPKSVFVNYDERDQKILKKLLKANDDVDQSIITQCLDEVIKDITQDIPNAHIRENIIIGRASAKIRGFKSTTPLKFFVMGFVFKEFKVKAKGVVWGFVLEPQGDGTTKTAPAKIIRNSDNITDIENFLEGIKYFNSYNVNVSVQGELKIDFDAPPDEPNLFFASDITKFNNIFEHRPSGLKISDQFSRLYKLSPSAVIENEAYPNLKCGLARQQKNNPKYTDEDDFKMLLVSITSDPRPTSLEHGYAVNGTSLYDSDETISIFFHDHKELIDFNKNDTIFAIGTVQKSNDSSYSEYQMEMIAMEIADLSKLNI